MNSKLEAHEKLKIAMQREIALMREILANMQQEELSLQHGDQTHWNHVVRERSQMVERLMVFRQERMEATETLKQFSPASKPIFSLDDDLTCELFWMRDQMAALMEKMNQQNSRNQHLYPNSFHAHAGPMSLPAAMPAAAPKKKGFLATEPRPEE